MLILLCLNWSNLPTMRYKTQLASIRFFFCNFQHLAQQQGQQKIQWSMLWKRTFRHFQLANMSNGRSIPHPDIMRRIKARVVWSQTGCEHWEHCTAYDPKRRLRRRHDGKRTFYARKRERKRSRILWSEWPQWQESEFMMQRQRWCKTGNIWAMLKRDDWHPQSLK